MRLLFQRNLSSALGKLHRFNQAVLGKEEGLEKKRKEVEKEYAGKMREVEQEARGIRNKAEQEALEIKDKILEEAQREKIRIVEQAIAEKERNAKELKTKMVRESISLGSNLIEYVFSGGIKQSIHIQLVDELINSLQSTVNSLQSADCKQAEISSVYPLEKQQREEFKKVLAEKIGQSIELKEKIDKEIIGGVIVKLDDVVIDGSLRNKLQKAMEKLEELHRS